MATGFRTGVLVAAWLIAGLTHPTASAAQWSLGLEIGSERYWGGSVDNSPERFSFRPHRPTILGAGLEHRSGAFGAALRLRYTDAGMGLEGEQAAAVVNGIFTVISAWPEISHRLLRVNQDNELLLHAGPLLEYWDLVDEDSRLRIGGQGAVSLSIPFGARFAMSLTAYAAVIGSPFEESELPSTYELRTLWRRGFSGGIRYRL